MQEGFSRTSPMKISAPVAKASCKEGVSQRSRSSALRTHLCKGYLMPEGFSRTCREQLLGKREQLGANKAQVRRRASARVEKKKFSGILQKSLHK